MKQIVGGKKNKGIFYGGKLYDGLPQNPSIKTSTSITITSKIISSAGTQNTSGYPVTFSFTSSKFDLYNSNLERLYSLPTYKVLLCTFEQTEINLISLVYDGDGLFHLSGDLSSIQQYSTAKASVSDVRIIIVDENNNIFLSTSNVISCSASSTASTVTFVAGTHTEENKKIDGKTYIDEIQLPFNVVSENFPDKSDEFPILWYVGNGQLNAFKTSQSYNIL